MADQPTPSAHTAGPWQVHLVGLQTVIRSRDGLIIAYGLFDERCNPPLEEVDANARLIAAAPFLLSNLRDASESYKDRLDALEEEKVEWRGMQEYDQMKAHYSALLRNAEAALASAL